MLSLSSVLCSSVCVFEEFCCYKVENIFGNSASRVSCVSMIGELFVERFMVCASARRHW